jgi:hypothetical protein
MGRIFTTLAVASWALMAAALSIGLGMGDLYTDVEAQRAPWASVHRLTGLAAALAVVLVASIVITYFIGTGRWCREVVEAYGLDAEFIRRSRRLKQRAFPWSLSAMLAVVGLSALGAAGDPMAALANGPRWAELHLIASMAGMAWVAIAFYACWHHVQANQQIIRDVVAEVTRIRRERGLPVESAEAAS